MKTQLVILFICLASFVSGQTPSPSPTAVKRDFTINWDDPNAQGKVTGYKVKYGIVSGTYPTVVDVPGQAATGTRKTKAFTNFPLGNVFLVVTAYDSANVESPPSPEIALTITDVLLPPGPITVISGIAQFNTRGKVGAGNEQMVASFKATKPIKVAIRALGPSLPASLNPVPGTKVQLRTTNGVIIEGNNGWMNGPDKQELLDKHLTPSSAAESALIANVDPGTYNVTVNYVNRTGVAEIELYQLP